MSYIYFGSKWKDKSLLDEIFIKYNIAFAGFKDDDADYKNALEKVKNTYIKKGTKIVIAEGIKVKAVGIALSDSITLDKLIKEYNNKDEEQIKNYLSYIDDTILCVKAELYKLSLEDEFNFGSQARRFCNIKDIITKDNIDKLLKKYSGNMHMENLKENCIKLLKENYNIVLTGAPGTGKTYLAKEMAKEIMKDNTHIKDYKKFIIDYYKNNKERLERFKEETDKLLQEFQQKFPQNKLKEISIEKYSAGNINKDSFCYWIEFKLKELGYFFPGNASTYLIYYDKEKNKYLNKSDIEDNEELIKEIGNSIYSMSETINYNGKLTFKDRFESLSMKIYNSYNPYYYFPIYHKKRMDGICNIFNIPIDNNIYRENLNLKKFFDDNFNIDSVIILKILNENQDLKNISNTEYNYRFVQFHPSYDYTDFVEGLRPIKDSNGNMVFERKDGVFKEFCKRALKNLIDSQKDVSELNKDTIIKNNLIKFIDDVSNIINEKGYFEIDGIDRKASPLKEIELNNDSVYFAPQIKSRLDITLTLDTIIDFYKKFIKVFEVKINWNIRISLMNLDIKESIHIFMVF
ncbi:AAA family ATPase [Brachyspira murdochii]|uniref:AAA family ATPase n=1 Tax=Brachyspira murdochii TaxID=84378 RepID=UPI0028006FC4|nr:AAA family ATPase [Brachyspira murdochii]